MSGMKGFVASDKPEVGRGKTIVLGFCGVVAFGALLLAVQRVLIEGAKKGRTGRNFNTK